MPDLEALKELQEPGLVNAKVTGPAFARLGESAGAVPQGLDDASVRGLVASTEALICQYSPDPFA
jgi:hypothetical protein